MTVEQNKNKILNYYFKRAGVFRLAVEQINNRSDLLDNIELVPLVIDTRASSEGNRLGLIERP